MPRHYHPLHIPNNGDLQRHLRPFVFLPNHHWRNQPELSGLYYLPIIREGEVKLPDKCDQECVHLDDPTDSKQPVD